MFCKTYLLVNFKQHYHTHTNNLKRHNNTHSQSKKITVNEVRNPSNTHTHNDITYQISKSNEG